MAARNYRRVVPLPDHLVARDVGEIGLFVFEQAKTAHEDTIIEMGDGEIRSESFADAWSELGSGDEVKSINADSWGTQPTLVLRWGSHSPQPQIVVTGSHLTQVLGVAEAVRLFIEKNMPTPLPTPGSPNASVQIAQVTHPDLDHVKGPDILFDLSNNRPRSSWRRVGAWIRRKREDLSVGVISSLVAGLILAVGTAVWALFW